jgi:hypothetical protein
LHCVQKPAFATETPLVSDRSDMLDGSASLLVTRGPCPAGRARQPRLSLRRGREGRVLRFRPC